MTAVTCESLFTGPLQVAAVWVKKFDICHFTRVIFVIYNTYYKLYVFLIPCIRLLTCYICMQYNNIKFRSLYILTNYLLTAHEPPTPHPPNGFFQITFDQCGMCWIALWYSSTIQLDIFWCILHSCLYFRPWFLMMLLLQHTKQRLHFDVFIIFLLQACTVSTTVVVSGH